MDKIDINKEYTCNGYPVINLQIKLYNSAGNLVTYPVKGVVVERTKSGKTSYVYAIWSIHGLANVVWPDKYKDKDLVLKDSIL